ncbi:hypothetical protein ACWD6P_27740 [Streptomyces sp. NPDC002446]
MARRGFPAREPAARRPRAVPGRWISAVVVGGLWWWAAVRLVVWPQSAGVVEGAVTLGGWGLSLLPVHCVPWTGRSEGRCRRGLIRGVRAVLTRAWRRRRSDGGSGRS